MPFEIAIVAFVVFLASAVGTFSGFGIATIMVPVLLLRYPLAETLLFVAVIHLFGDIWKLWFFRQGIRWRIVLTFAAFGVPATILGASLVPHLPPSPLSRVLGAFLLLYVAFLAARPAFRVEPRTLTTAAGGGLYGFFAGVFGVSGEIRGAVLSAYDLPKAVFLFTNGAVALLVDGARIMTYLAGGVRLELFPAWSLALFIAASFAGASIGSRFVDRVPQKAFRRVVAALLFLAGLKLLLSP